MPRFSLAEDGAEIVAGMQPDLLHDTFLQFGKVRTRDAERRFEVAAIERFDDLGVFIPGTGRALRRVVERLVQFSLRDELRHETEQLRAAREIMLACSISAMILLTFAFSPRSYAGALSARAARD